MSTELETATSGALAVQMPNFAAMQQASDFGDKQADSVFGAGFNFLPRLQLFGGNSEEVKDGTIPIGTYGIVKFGEETIIQLGKTVLVSPLVYRTKAMFLKPADMKPLSYFDKDSPEFKEVVRIANYEQANNVNPKSGNVYGPEFLLWLGSEHGFVSFFMNNATMRNEAPAVRGLCPRPDGSWKTGLLSANLIKNDRFSWHGPKIAPSSQALDGADPSVAEQVAATFLKPTASQPKAPAVAAPAEAVQGDR